MAWWQNEGNDTSPQGTGYIEENSEVRNDQGNSSDKDNDQTAHDNLLHFESLALLEEGMLLCDIESRQDLHWVRYEAVNADAEVNECHVSRDWVEVQDENAIAIVLVGCVGDHGKHHEKSEDADDG